MASRPESGERRFEARSRTNAKARSDNKSSKFKVTLIEVPGDWEQEAVAVSMVLLLIPNT